MAPSDPGRPAAEDDALRVSERVLGEVAVLTLEGDLDLRSAPALRVRLAELVRAADTHVVLDLDHVAFVDSTGLAVLLNVLRRLTRAGRRLHLACGDGPVRRILRLTRLDGTFAVFATTEQAVAALEPAD